MRTVVVRALLVAALLAPGWAPAAVTDPAVRSDVRRLLMVMAGIRDEYAEALDEDGRVVRPVEIEEAKLLIAEGRDLVRRLGDVAPGDTAEVLGRLEGQLTSVAPSDEVASVVDELRDRIETATGVVDAAPPAAPSRQRGAALFADNCAGCHGPAGAGDGPEAATLGVKPANFSDPTFMRGETPRDFFNVISLGRRRSGMPAWDESLGVQDRWDLVAHLWTLTGVSPSAGRDAYQDACASCHGTGLEGSEKGPRLADPTVLARWSEDALARDLDDATHAAVPVVASGSEETRRRIAAFVQQRALVSEPEEPGEPEEATVDIRGIAAARRLVTESLAAARADKENASSLATEAYVAFEPFEPGLRVRQAKVVERVEQAFVAYRLALRGDADEARLLQLSRDVDVALADAEIVLRAAVATGWKATFGQAIAIVVREGLEIILIVGALLTWVRRSGRPDLVRVIHGAVAGGVLASLATAFVLMTGLQRLPWAKEAIEGVAMLIASLVLFWVSYWLISKAEADRWQRFIRDKVETAIGTGSRAALAGAAFLAVYREGFETVLFYQALVASGGGAGPATVGFLAGGVLLALVYAVMRWLGMQIPIRPFFLVTGALLYGLAIVFAGRGVAELQEAALVGMTPVPYVPTLPALGVFPTVETVAAQGVLLALLVLAAVVTVRRRRVAAVAAALVVIAASLPTSGFAGTAEPVGTAREWLMGTVAEIDVYAIDDLARTSEAMEAAFAELRTVDRLMAVQRPDSDVSRMNREAAARSVRVDPRVVEVLRVSRAVSALTHGAFDPTVLPVVEAWGFLEGPPHRPAASPPHPAGWRHVALDVSGESVRFTGRGVGVDLGGIAKGYALDRARGILLDRGVRSAWLDLGGNIATIGTPVDGPVWRVGIRDPRHDDALLGVIEVGEASVSTSSDAERYVEDDEGRAGHVIDPRTGAPATGLMAATVVAASATLADALSTTAIVVGESGLRPMLQRTRGEALFVHATTTEDAVVPTEGLVFEPAARPSAS